MDKDTTIKYLKLLNDMDKSILKSKEEHVKNVEQLKEILKDEQNADIMNSLFSRLINLMDNTLTDEVADNIRYVFNEIGEANKDVYMIRIDWKIIISLKLSKEEKTKKIEELLDRVIVCDRDILKEALFNLYHSIALYCMSSKWELLFQKALDKIEQLN